MGHDVRAIANFVLNLAASQKREITNMHINKIVYFLHADYLVAFGKPLASAKIEAWEHGPVFRELYREFKKFGDKPITSLATRVDPNTGNREIATTDFSESECAFLSELTIKYCRIPASALRAHSHEAGGPWDNAWNHDNIANASMRISDDRIKSWYERTLKH